MSPLHNPRLGLLVATSLVAVLYGATMSHWVGLGDTAMLIHDAVHLKLSAHANNHRTRCNLNPIDALETFNPVGARLDDVYVVEKIETKEGWSKPAPDEDWMHGYPAEVEEFYRCIGSGERPDSDAELGYATVATIYAGYVSAEERGAEVEVPPLVEG